MDATAPNNSGIINGARRVLQANTTGATAYVEMLQSNVFTRREMSQLTLNWIVLYHKRDGRTRVRVRFPSAPLEAMLRRSRPKGDQLCRCAERNRNAESNFKQTTIIDNNSVIYKVL
jgi:hypothetical protein